jgi:hypothetical protein
VSQPLNNSALNFHEARQGMMLARSDEFFLSMCPVKCVNRLCVVPHFLPRHQLRLLCHLHCSLQLR